MAQNVRGSFQFCLSCGYYFGELTSDDSYPRRLSLAWRNFDG